MDSAIYLHPKAQALSPGATLSSRDIWWCRRVFSIITAGEMVAIGMQRVEKRDATKHPRRTGRRPPGQRTIYLPMSVMPRLRNPDLQHAVCVFFLLPYLLCLSAL